MITVPVQLKLEVHSLAATNFEPPALGASQLPVGSCEWVGEIALVVSFARSALVTVISPENGPVGVSSSFQKVWPRKAPSGNRQLLQSPYSPAPATAIFMTKLSPIGLTNSFGWPAPTLSVSFPPGHVNCRCSLLVAGTISSPLAFQVPVKLSFGEEMPWEP